ncbi:MAG: MCE family protein, partial [Acidimicrobiaceae bacterium]|nr:MCE family protein [Acidimicrobiaceae bacterium]
PAQARRTRRLAILGIVLAAAVIGTFVLIFESFTGAFSTYAALNVQLPASSTAVQLNSPVEYRNVTVGKVASQGRSVPGGLVTVAVHLKVSELHNIPSDVRATVTPVSIFGNEYIVLQAPAHPGPGTLRDGQTIRALNVGQTASLQQALTDLDYLLKALHPGELDAALSALAGALQGQGTSLGQNLVQGNNYLQGMLPLWPTVVADLQTLVPVANQFAASTPDILGILANQTTTANTVNSLSKAVHQALSGGATLTGETSQLLAAIQAPFAVLAADSGPFLQDISQNPHEISQILQGFDAWARAWVSAESAGPYLSLNATLNVANPASLGRAIVGGPTVVSDLASGLGSNLVNPPTYTSADCPRFGSLASVNCGGTMTASSVQQAAKAALSSALSAAPAPLLAEPAQQQAVGQIVDGLNGARPTSRSVDTLLLSPVLVGLVTRR